MTGHTHSEAECIANIQKVEDLLKRCEIKDNHLSSMMEKVAKLEESSENLEDRVTISEAKVVELQAWKNKALGYLGALGVFTAYIIEMFRETFLDKQ